MERHHRHLVHVVQVAPITFAYFKHRNRDIDYLSAESKRVGHTNILDMCLRRSRAYQPSQTYSRHHNVAYDLFLFIRLDSAFYAPRLELLQYNHALVDHKVKTNESVVIIPTGCNFA